MTPIETVIGPLAETYKLLQPESILHADELMKEWRMNEELREQCFYTADGIVYSLQGRKKVPTLAMTRGSSNPLFQDSTIDEYCRQLLDNGNYCPTPEETQRALHAPDTVVIDLTALRLQKSNEESTYLAINPREYNTLNSEEQKLAQRVYGKDDDFGLTMKMLADAGIRETRVHVLDLEYVRTHAQESALGRAAWLIIFDISSDFLAIDRYVISHSRVRGVRREEVARSAAP